MQELRSNTAVDFDSPGAGIDGSTLRELSVVMDRAWASGPGGIHPSIVHDAVEAVIDALDAGQLRVAERQSVGGVSYFAKVDSKFSGFDEAEMRASGVR